MRNDLSNVVIWSHLAIESFGNPPSLAGSGMCTNGCGLKFGDDVVGTTITSLVCLFLPDVDTIIAVLG